MLATKLTGLAVYGATLLGAASVFSALSPAPDRSLEESVNKCVNQQFQENGFALSAPNGNKGRTTKGERPDAPSVTVFFRVPNEAELRIGDLGGRFPIEQVTKLELAQKVAAEISSRCLSQYKRQGSAQHRAQPS
jgi:hypothetical protein